jgi:hypothetical protein
MARVTDTPLREQRWVISRVTWYGAVACWLECEALGGIRSHEELKLTLVPNMRRDQF